MINKLFAFLAISLIVISCSDGIVSECPDDIKPTKLRATFSSIQSELFDKNCATVGCHAAPIPASGLNLSAGVSYNNTVNKIAFGDTKYIEPGDVEASWLFQRVNSNSPGSVMPPTGKLPQYMIDSLRVWIDAGALNN